MSSDRRRSSFKYFDFLRGSPLETSRDHRDHPDTAEKHLTHLMLGVSHFQTNNGARGFTLMTDLSDSRIRIVLTVPRGNPHDGRVGFSPGGRRRI